MASKRKQQNIEIDMDEDLIFENEEEKRKIYSLPQIEREEIILDKIQKYQEKKDREQLLQEEKYIEAPKKEKQKEALEEIKRKKLTKVNRKISSEDGEISVDNENEDEESSDNDESIFDLNEENKAITEHKFTLDIRELEKIKVSRLFFQTFHDHKMFNQTVINCAVRLNLGGNKKSTHNYMIGVIKEVITVPNEPYTIGDKKYNKYFIAKHGDSEKRFSFSIVSNSNFEEFEFEKWKMRLERAGMQLPDMEYINKKEEEIEKMKNYKYDDEEYFQLILDKKMEKIRNKDKNLNITHEVEEFSEKYEASKQKLKELEDEFPKIASSEKRNKAKKEIEDLKKIIHDLEHYMTILIEMQGNRIEESKEKTKNELSYKINQKNLEKQKEKNVQNRLLKNKRLLEESNNAANPYKRRECNPMSLFTKDIDVTAPVIQIDNIKMTKVDDDPYAGTPKELYDRRREEIEKNKIMFEKFNNDFNEKANKLMSKFTNSTKLLSQEKKGHYGVLNTSRINVKEYITNDNDKLLEKYGITDVKSLSNFTFV